MQFEISDHLKRKARAPHELFLTNLVANHILWFVAALGVFYSYPQPVMLVPVFSACVITYTIFRARKALNQDDWFVMCHWQLAARRNKAFAIVLLIGVFISFLGWLGYTFSGMRQEAVLAMVGGIGLLPVMVSVLVLIVMESDGMHQANSGKIPQGIYNRFPNEDMVPLDEVDLDADVHQSHLTSAVSERMSHEVAADALHSREAAERNSESTAQSNR